MSNAEKMAWLVFPESVVIDSSNENTGVDFNLLPRNCFRMGYEQAEKDMMERFIRFIHRHYPINYTGWIQDFQRAMEG